LVKIAVRCKIIQRNVNVKQLETPDKIAIENKYEEEKHEDKIK
jgi:hypothetical protein